MPAQYLFVHMAHTGMCKLVGKPKRHGGGTLEIKIASEDLTKVLWTTSIVLTLIGFLLAVAGLIVTLTVDEGARVQEAVFPVTLTVTGVALAVIPWCLASSVSRLLDTLE